jgi:mannan endo-1,4-beta-mannosidase
MDEFGMARDSGQIRIGTTVTTRDQYFGLLYAMVYDSARAGAPISGSNFWTWSGEGTAQHDDGVWREHDSFTGDPPQEPQGRNSVFAADKSTIEIISGHAKKMQRLGIADSIYFGSQ